MEIYSTEEQQVEAIKSFWKENGMQIVVGALLGLGGFIGYNQYVDSKLAAQEEASASYQAFVEATQISDVSAETYAAELKTFTDAHGDSGYGAFANLLAAKNSVENGEFDKAIGFLESAKVNVTDDSLTGLIDTRLARIYLELSQYDKALSVLAAITNEGYKARASELKGDVYLAQGDATKARMEYQAAADAGGLDGNNLLQMKIDDLTVSNNG